MSPDQSAPGYDTDYDPAADPHAPGLGDGAPTPRYRDLPAALTGAQTVSSLVDVIRLYGWVPPLLIAAVHGTVRGLFEHASEPFALSQGYVFEGWPAAFGINIVYGTFLTGFIWFLYFGVIGSFAGFFSDEAAIETDVFKVGGYLLAVFVPLLTVSSLLAATIPSSVASVASDRPAAVIEAHRAIDATLQMRVASALLAFGWIVVGFLMLPIVSELYDVDTKASVISVLPVTLVAVVATVLV